MIEIFKWDGKWRIRIVDETLQLEDDGDFKEILDILINLKATHEPYKNEKIYVKNPFKSLNKLREEKK